MKELKIRTRTIRKRLESYKRSSTQSTRTCLRNSRTTSSTILRGRYNYNCKSWNRKLPYSRWKSTRYSKRSNCNHWRTSQKYKGKWNYLQEREMHNISTQCSILTSSLSFSIEVLFLLIIEKRYRIFQNCTLLKYQPNQIVYREGEINEHMYVVIKGCVKQYETKSTSYQDKV